MKVKNKNIKVEFKIKDGESIFVDAIQTYQPERSKREDLCSICERSLSKKEGTWFCDECSRCGALNSSES